MKLTTTILFAVSFLILAQVQAAVFTDFTEFNPSSETATGTVNGVGVLLECTRAVPRIGVGDNGGVVGGATNGSSTTFILPAFTPPLAAGDEIVLGGASDFKITFAQPVSNITLHFAQLQANRLSFTSGGAAAAFTLLSSDGDFLVSPGNTAIQGTPGNGDDASGSLFFAGVFSELSWTSGPGIGTTGSTPNDGFWLQLSLDPQPQLNIARQGAQAVRITWSTNHTSFALESAATLPASNWEPTTNAVFTAGQDFSVTVDVDEMQRFFRLRKN